MSRRYDSRTTIFSPEGRLYQVEYAMEAIGHAGTALGIRTNEGVVLAAERRHLHKLLDDDVGCPSDKIYKLDDNIACNIAGLTSDAYLLVNELRVDAQRYKLQFGECIPVEQLVKDLCNTKQAYTQFGSKRPFGTSIIYAGHDKHHGFQLYLSDPSGNYGGWKATCIGNNSNTAMSILKTDYKDEMTIEDGLSLALKVLNKTLDVSKLSADRFEICVLKLDENGKTQFSMVSQKEREKQCEILAEELEKSKKEAQAKLKETSSKSSK